MKVGFVLANTLVLTTLCAEAFVAKPTTIHSVRTPRHTALKMTEDVVSADDAKVCLITGASRGIGKW